uniref:Uncharacterized protein n=1 Tax=Glycine max TaxID=3847 RepID=C6T1B5_SOYBN|nr:unknown [Glycine max]
MKHVPLRCSNFCYACEFECLISENIMVNFHTDETTTSPLMFCIKSFECKISFLRVLSHSVHWCKCKSVLCNRIHF